MESVIPTLLLTLFTGVLCQENILLNPGFEDPIDGNDWYCDGNCSMTQDPDAYAGSFSAYISERAEVWNSPSQDVPLQPNTHYYFNGYVKLAEMNEGAMWHQVDMMIRLEFEEGDPEDVWFGRMPYLRMEQGWQKIGADFHIDNRTISRFVFYILVNKNRETPVSFYLDETSLVVVQPNPNWKEEANARIEEMRKNEVTINLSVSGDYDPNDLQLQVNQTKLAYPFGTAVQDAQIAGDTDYNLRYQDTFYTHYNWAVLENALKWRAMEPERGEITYPDESISRLNANGIPVRGHCVFWGKWELTQRWLRNLTSEELLFEMQKRIDDVITRYDDQLVHWDVNNEQEHGAWYELKTENPYIMNDMFTDIRARDSDVVLFPNDYHIISSGIHTQSYVNKAIEVNTSTGEVGGLGVQSHIQGVPDYTAIQLQLDIAATSGFPVWITELDIEIADREQRADAYDDLVTLYYSHPNVDGILMWGFSDLHHWRPDCALFEGEFFEPNAAGLRWQEMIFNRWRSYETFFPTSSEETFGFSGFHGSYEIQVLNLGEEISTQTFEVQPGQDVTVEVSV